MFGRYVLDQVKDAVKGELKLAVQPLYIKLWIVFQPGAIIRNEREDEARLIHAAPACPPSHLKVFLGLKWSHAFAVKLALAVKTHSSHRVINPYGESFGAVEDFHELLRKELLHHVFKDWQKPGMVIPDAPAEDASEHAIVPAFGEARHFPKPRQHRFNLREFLLSEQLQSECRVTGVSRTLSAAKDKEQRGQITALNRLN